MDRTLSACQALTLRLAYISDVEALERFYTEHNHPGLDRRRVEVYEERIRSGSVHLIVEENNQICGSSIAYDYSANSYTEYGSTRIICPTGFPLYEYLVSAQALHTFFFNPPTHCPIGNINMSNRNVAERLQTNLLWEPFAAPAEVTQMNEAMILTRKETVQWFACPVTALGKYAQLLCNLLVNPILENKRGRRVSLLCSSLPIVAEYAARLRSLPAALAAQQVEAHKFAWAATKNTIMI